MREDAEIVEAICRAIATAADSVAATRVLDQRCGSDGELRRRVMDRLRDQGLLTDVLLGPALAGLNADSSDDALTDYPLEYAGEETILESSGLGIHSLDHEESLSRGHGGCLARDR
jgi:hypothetical protein